MFIFAVDEGSDSFFDIVLNHPLLIFGRGDRPGEESFEGECPPGAGEPFVVAGAGYRRDVDPEGIGDLLHFQGADSTGAVVEKVALVVDNRLGHRQNGSAPRRDGVDEPLGAADIAAQIGLGFGGDLFFAQFRAILGTDPQVEERILLGLATQRPSSVFSTMTSGIT